MQPRYEDFQADLQLVREAIQGSRPAIDRIVERMRCVPLILEQRNKRSGSPLSEHDLQDLVQDTLRLVWTRLDSYQGKGALESWVYTFCIYTLMNAIRSKQVHPQAVDPAEVDRWTDDRSAGPERGYEAVYLGLDRLDPSQRDVIRLKHFESLNFEEIARVMSLAPNTVKSHYYRGLQRLRQFLEPDMREGYA